MEKNWGTASFENTTRPTFSSDNLLSFIRPTLEYGDVIWDNLSQGLKDQLDKVQNEAARIVTGCAKLVAIADLIQESGWETLSERRRKHKLIHFYKMVNGLSPNYLNILVPPTIGNLTTYNKRRPNNLRTIACRTSLYNNSFLPSVISDWNFLRDEIKNAESLTSFKYHLNLDKPAARPLYFFGERKIQIIHARLRNRCCSLNNHFYLKHLVQSPLCRCGSVESTEHYFLECPIYNELRNRLYSNINQIVGVSLQIILYWR